MCIVKSETFDCGKRALFSEHCVNAFRYMMLTMTLLKVSMKRCFEGFGMPFSTPRRTSQLPRGADSLLQDLTCSPSVRSST